MKIKALSAAIAVMLFVAANAQSSFKPGYVVGNAGDTTKGFIEEGNEAKLYKTVPFKKDVNGTAQNYVISDLHGFGFTGGSSFAKISFTSKDNTTDSALAKVMLKGYYSVYSFLRDDRRFVVIKTLTDSSYLLYDDDIALYIYNSNNEPGTYKNVLRFIARDCGNLKDNADRLPYDDRAIMRFVNSVNNCVAPATASQQLYVKPVSKFRLYAYAGGITMGTNQYEYTGRLIGRVSLPGIDKHTSLNFGVNYQVHQSADKPFIYSGYYNRTTTLSEFTIPLTVQYNILSGIVQPYVAGGVSLVRKTDKELITNYRTTNETSWAGSVIGAIGIECFITKFLMVKADFMYDNEFHYPTIGVGFFIK